MIAAIYKEARDPFADYVCLKRIGAGGYCDVFLVRGKRDNKLYAMKRYNDLFLNVPDTKNILKELVIYRTLLKNASPLFPKMKDVFVHSGDCTKNFPFFKSVSAVIELCDMDLRRFLMAGRPLSFPDAKLLCYNMAECVREFHRLGVFHRDLKPENFLVSLGSLDVKLADFNHAKLIAATQARVPCDWEGKLLDRPSRDKALNTQILGTRYYRAPEILLLEEYDSKIDVWALGCIMWEVLAKAVNGSQQPLFIGKYCETISPTEKENLQQAPSRPKLLVLSPEDQLLSILRLLGHQQAHAFAFVSNPKVRKFLEAKNAQNDAGQILKAFEHKVPDFEDFARLLAECLSFNPVARATIEEVCRHPFFKEFSGPLRPSCTPRPSGVDDSDLCRLASIKSKDQVLLAFLKELNFYRPVYMYKELVEPLLEQTLG